MNSRLVRIHPLIKGLYMILKIFNVKRHHRNDYFQKIGKIHVFVKIVEFTLVIMFMIFPKNDNLGLKMNFKIFRNSA